MTATERPEVTRLARLLRVESSELDFLLDVDDAELRVFRDQVTDKLFDSGAGMYKRVAAAVRLLPATITARIAQRAFGPLLAARIAGRIDTDKAVAIAKRLDTEFITDLAIDLDPRRAQDLLGRIPAELVEAIAAELGRRGDWLTIGRFVGFLPDESLSRALAVLDDAAVVHVAAVIDDVSAIPAVIDLVPPNRVSTLLTSASADQLFAQLFVVIQHLRDDQLLDLAATARSLSPDVRAAIAEHARVLDVTADLGPIADALSERAA